MHGEQPALEGAKAPPIRGWLIVIAVILISTLLRLGATLLYAIDALDAAGWSAEAVQDGFGDGTVFLISTVVTAMLFVWWLGVTVLFFYRSRRFPSATTALLASWLLLILAQMILFRAEPGGVLAVQVIWISSIFLYLRRSKRVKATFVR